MARYASIRACFSHTFREPAITRLSQNTFTSYNTLKLPISSTMTDISKEDQLPPTPLRNSNASPSLESLLREGLAHSPGSYLGPGHVSSNVLMGSTACSCRDCAPHHNQEQSSDAAIRLFTYHVIQHALVIIDETVLELQNGCSDDLEATSSN